MIAFKVCSRAIWYSGYSVVGWFCIVEVSLPSLVCLNPQNPRRGTLIYVLGIIILVNGILVIEGIGRYCTLVSVGMILFYFLCWVVWKVPGIYSRYLDMWDNVIRAMVYIIRVSSCEMIYLILFCWVGMLVGLVDILISY